MCKILERMLSQKMQAQLQWSLAWGLLSMPSMPRLSLLESNLQPKPSCGQDLGAGKNTLQEPPKPRRIYSRCWREPHVFRSKLVFFGFGVSFLPFCCCLLLLYLLSKTLWRKSWTCPAKDFLIDTCAVSSNSFPIAGTLRESKPLYSRVNRR